MRSVPEWIGKNDDQMPPASVLQRLWRQQAGRCPVCTRKLEAGNLAADHIRALCLGGLNAESNMRLVCEVPCHSSKTRREQRVKAKADRVLAKHFNFKSPSKAKGRPFPGSRRDKWKKKVNGQVVLRDPPH